VSDEFATGRAIEVTGHVATVAEKVTGRHRQDPWATVRFHGIGLDLNVHERLWNLYWRDIKPGVKLSVTGLVDARKPKNPAVTVREVVLLQEEEHVT
jgi:hypothetical protein